MAVIVKDYTFSAGATIIAAEHNDNFDTIYDEFNGNISNANISATAAIAGSKLGTLATITSAAGIIPQNNIAIAGVWTAGFAASGTGVITIADVSSAGYFMKVGDKITISGKFVVSQVSSGAGGNLTLSGLPYSSGNSAWHNSFIGVYAYNVSSSNSQIMAYVSSGSTAVTLQRLTAGLATGMAADVKSATHFIIGGTYFTD